MDLGLWTPSVRDSGWQYTGCWFQLSPHMEDVWHLLAPRFPVTCRLYFQTVQTCHAPESHSCSAQHGGGGDNMRQSSNGPRPFVSRIPSSSCSDVTGSAGYYPSPTHAHQRLCCTAESPDPLSLALWSQAPCCSSPHFLAVALWGQVRVRGVSSAFLPWGPTACRPPCSAPGPSPSFSSQPDCRGDSNPSAVSKDKFRGSLCLKIYFLLLLLRKGLLR